MKSRLNSLAALLLFDTGTPLNEMMLLLEGLRPFVRFLMIFHKFFVPEPKSLCSMRECHLLLTCSRTIDFISLLRAGILGLDGSCCRRWSRRSARRAAAVGKFGLITGMDPAGMNLPAAILTSFRKDLSPAKMHVGGGIVENFSSR